MKAPFARFEVKGTSMLPMYQSGDRVLVFRWGAVHQGDVVVCCKNGMKMVKRLASKVADRWCVRGDNLSASTDSVDFGSVSDADIVGRVVAKY